MRIKLKNGDEYIIDSNFVFQLEDKDNPSRFHIGQVADNLEDTIRILETPLKLSRVTYD